MTESYWPGLRGWDAGIPAAIKAQRAVYGKVHRAPTDYRWIAWSAAISPADVSLERELALGSEQAPSVFFCWRSTDSGAIAVKCYPSRASDAAGRPAGLEKQILCTDDGSVPPAVLAFALLGALAPADDSVWWDTWRDSRWRSLEFHLDLPESDCRVVPADLFESVARGVEELNDAVEEARLERFYADLLGGVRPALMRDQKTPLTPLALAAMLLPLEPEFTRELNLAGGFPSPDLQAQRFPHWTAITCPPGVAVSETITGSPDRDRAARAVSLLKAPREHRTVPASLSSGASFLIAFLESEERWFAPGELGALSLAQTGPWPVVRHPGERVYLRRRVSEFVRSTAGMPDGSPARRHLETKADLLRALLLALCPGPESIHDAGLPTTGLVPALLFACRIERSDWSEFARYPPEQFKTLARQSLEGTRIPAFQNEVRTWLDVAQPLLAAAPAIVPAPAVSKLPPVG